MLKIMPKQHLIDLNDFSKQEWEDIVSLAIKIHDSPESYSDDCKGKILATLFYEPSTRTQMSFQTAMLRLGGDIIGFDNPQNSSVAKGENLVDTIKVISGYADIIAMRHPVEGGALAAAGYADCPIINAGDGGHLHPTQTLTDLVTMKYEIGHFDNLTIGLCGDLKNGRTVHSLIKVLAYYKNIKFIFISTPELTIPKYFKDIITSLGNTFEEIPSLSNAISKLDVLYMTRIQKERFKNLQEYENQKNVYILNAEKLVTAKKELIILHPLPRVDEISLDVDNDLRAVYFKQARYGVYARMALILTLLKCNKNEPILKGENINKKCVNPDCVTNKELYLSKSFIKENDHLRCEYCDAEII